jgi:hypothetical protein
MFTLLILTASYSKATGSRVGLSQNNRTAMGGRVGLLQNVRGIAGGRISDVIRFHRTVSNDPSKARHTPTVSVTP